MKTNLLVFAMFLFATVSFGQKNLVDTLNGDFEKGTLEYWRFVEVGASVCSAEITDDANNGNYAAKVTWGVDAGLQDVVFDYWDVPYYLPCLGDTDYVFKASAYMEGSGILRMNMTFFDGDSGLVNGTIVGDYADISWQPGSFYEDHEWVVRSPETAKSVIIGFRVFNADSSRWPTETVITYIDDVQLWEGNTPTTDVRTHSIDNHIRVYPNPSSDQLKIQTDSYIEKVSIYNLTGQMVKDVQTREEKNAIIDISDLSPGIYLVKVKSSNGYYTGKVVKE
jgi:hypothetical protein